MCVKCVGPDSEAAQLKAEDLAFLPYTPGRWLCVVPGCKNGTAIRDYGLFPMVYWPKKDPLKYHWKRKGLRRNFKPGLVNYTNWFSAYSHYFICGKHNKMHKPSNYVGLRSFLLGNDKEKEAIVNRTFIFKTSK